MDEALVRAPVGLLETTPDGNILDANDTAATVLQTAREHLHGTDIREVFPESAAGTLRAAFAETPPSERRFEEYYPPIDRWLAVSVVRGDGRVLVYVRDCSGRYEKEREADQLEQRLERLERIDTVISEILRELIDASDRREVARAVCGGVGSVERYGFCWVGEREPAGEDLRLLAAAGDDGETRERIAAHLQEGEDLPERTAVEVGETRWVAALAEEESVPRPIRLAAFGRGLQSVLAVPLASRGVVYGVLGVYSTDEGGFSEQERTSLETLGLVAGFAIHAARQAELVDADRLVEVTLDVSDPTVPFVAAAREGETRLSVETVIRRDDETSVCYLRGTEAETAVTEQLNNHEAVKTVRPVRSAEEEFVAEVALSESTPVGVLSARAVRIEELTATAENEEIVFRAQSGADIRGLVRSVGETAGEVSLVSKIEQPAAADEEESLLSEFDDKLTDRQRTVLRTAYAADYFTSPRGSSAEDVAAALDVTGPTVLYHLRAAQRKLLDAYFGSDAETRNDE